MSDDKIKNLRFIIPVETIPGIKKAETSLYGDIINEFLISKLKYAEVTLENKDPFKIRNGLRHYIKKKSVGEIEVRCIGKKVYLERKNGP